MQSLWFGCLFGLDVHLLQVQVCSLTFRVTDKYLVCLYLFSITKKVLLKWIDNKIYILWPVLHTNTVFFNMNYEVLFLLTTSCSSFWQSFRRMIIAPFVSLFLWTHWARMFLFTYGHRSITNHIYSGSNPSRVWKRFTWF